MEEMREITCKVIRDSSIIPVICTPHLRYIWPKFT